MSEIFIHFSQLDRAAGREIAQFISKQRGNFEIQWDPDADHDTAPSREIKAAIRSAKAVIVLWSERSIFQPRSLAAIREGGKKRKLVIVRLDESKIPDELIEAQRSPVVEFAEFGKLQMYLTRLLSRGRNALSEHASDREKFNYNLARITDVFKSGLGEVFSLLVKVSEKVLYFILKRFKRQIGYGVVILIMLAVVKLFWDGRASEDAQAFAQAQTANTITAYQGYLSNHPYGKFRISASQAVDELQTLNGWRKARKADTIASYEDFLRAFPEGRRVAHPDSGTVLADLAKATIEEIDKDEDAAWMKAVDDDDINGYQTYLMDFPKGRHANIAGEIIDTMLQNGLFGTIQRGDASFTSVGWVGNGRELMFASLDATWGIVDVASQKLVTSVEAHNGPVFAATVVPAESRVMSAGADGAVKLWSRHSDIPEQVFKAHNGSVYGVSFSGKLAVSAGLDGQLVLWDLQQGRRLRPLKAHKGGAFAVAVSRNGRLIASGGALGEVKIWDRFSAHLLKTLPGHEGAVNAIKFSPNGETVLSAGADGVMRLWSVRTGNLKATFKGHFDKVNDVAFSADGDLILSASSDASLRLWDAHTGRSLRVMEGHAGEVYALALSPDGRHAISAGADRTIKLWTVSPEPNRKLASWLGLDRSGIY